MICKSAIAVEYSFICAIFYRLAYQLHASIKKIIKTLPLFGLSWTAIYVKNIDNTALQTSYNRLYTMMAISSMYVYSLTYLIDIFCSWGFIVTRDGLEVEAMVAYEAIILSIVAI